MLTFFKKTVIALFFFFFFNCPVRAQWVTISDTNFVAYLQQNYSACMNGNLMDTTCGSIISSTRVTFNGTNSVKSLNGIQYFDGLDTLSITGCNLQANGLPDLPANLKFLRCSGNLLTNLPSLPLTLTELDCSQNHLLTSLPTLPPNLITLSCYTNQLTSLPSLPNGLIDLYCYNNQLTTFPSLPSSLSIISAAHNQLSVVPSLPSSLTWLDCSYSQLTSLPALPAALTYLYCWNNQLTSLPTLPQSLIWLQCDSNQLNNLPQLPGSLKTLNCYYNQITNLPVLPDSLIGLGCAYNLLTSLPQLPDSLVWFDCPHNLLTYLPAIPVKVTSLTCSDNKLTSLPALPPHLTHLLCNDNMLSGLPVLPVLPSTLYYIHCFNNQLLSLPPLPIGLDYLLCQNNQIFCFPSLPSSLVTAWTFDISDNPFTCLPNYVAAMDSATLAIPLCLDNDLINNPNACAGFKGVYGYTYKDVNTNCSREGVDGIIKNIPIELFDSIGNLKNTFYTLSSGVYNYILDSGAYTIAIDTLNKPYIVSCIYPGIDTTFSLTTSNPLAKDVNLDIGCKPGFDFGVKSINVSGWIFPGISHTLNVSAGDLSKWFNLNCANGVGGTVTITVNGPVTYDYTPAGSLIPSNISTNVFTYNISDFSVINLNAFAIRFFTDTTAQTWSSICVTVDVTPTVGDYDTTNNQMQFCYYVTNSYDPNDKQVYPTSVNPAYNGYFTYTINFQNVGTAAAQNIRVVDTLASNLDLSTFEIINYSHANTSTLTGNVATFRFPNIQLPDSASNPEGSKGFIQYRIKPVANLPFGTQIKNKADIYFDFNSPITTNTAVSTFNSTVGLSPNSSPQERGVTVYPNPGKGVFNLRFSDNSASTKTIEVFNLIGEKVFSGIAKADNSIVDLSKKENGIYVLRVCNATTVFTQRLIKQ